MAILSPERVESRMGQLFFPLAIATTAIAILVIQSALEPAYAMYGLYGLLGLLAGGAVYYATDAPAQRAVFDVPERTLAVGVYVVAALTLGAVAVTGTGILVALGLGVAYVFVVAQLMAGPSPRRLVPQLAALFLLSPLTKHLTTGLYFAHGDTIEHVGRLDDMLAAGLINVETAAYAGYQDFPGLHMLAATVGELAGLTPEGALTVSGVLAQVLVVPGGYLVVREVTRDRELALYAAVGLVVLDDLSFFAGYAFPQSLATVMVVVLAVLAAVVRRDDALWGGAVAFGVVALALAFTHHLTQFLFLPLFGLAFALYAAHGREYAARLLRSRYAALFAFALALTAVRWYQAGFISRVVGHATAIVYGGLRGEDTQSLVFAYGTSAPTTTVASVAEWLVSPYGLFLIALVLAFSVGVVSFLRGARRGVAYAALAWTGVVAAFLVFETPVAIQSLVRIRYPWLFVFAVVLGLGLLQLRLRAGSNAASSLLLVVLVFLAATAPVVTMDDHYGLDPRPATETSFSDEQYQELRMVSGFVDEREEPTTVFWNTRRTMRRFGVGPSEVQRAEIRDEELLLPAGYFVYRTAWTDHEVEFSAGDEGYYENNLYVSQAWLERQVGSGNKVYTTGGTGILWENSTRPFER